MPPSDDDARNALRHWVGTKAGLDVSADLDALRLFEGRVLNSLDFIELVVLIERIGRAPVDVETLRPDDVASIDAIVGRFFASARAR